MRLSLVVGLGVVVAALAASASAGLIPYGADVPLLTAMIGALVLWR